MHLIRTCYGIPDLGDFGRNEDAGQPLALLDITGRKFYFSDGVEVTEQSIGVAWGDITGALSGQDDLRAALDAKEPSNANIQAHVASSHAPSDAQKNADITKAEIEAKLTGQIASHTHAGGSEAFPVGSVFIAVVDTNPGTLLGYGTWSAFGAGRMLVGLDSGDTDFDTVEETGGAKTHTLTATEMPAHTHTQDAHSHVLTQLRDATTGGATTNIALSADTSSTLGTKVTGSTTATNQNTGGGGAHNNMPPYIVVYMWKRTA